MSAAAVAATAGRILLALPDSSVSREVLTQIQPSLCSGAVLLDATTGDPEEMGALGRRLADATRDWQPEWVCGPATGGLIIAQWTAHALGVPMVEVVGLKEVPEGLWTLLVIGMGGYIGGRSLEKVWRK